ncbi:MAG: LPS export ABC transporter periplasmic protein LptC [Heliobacteriaceae bacterium]|jgi:LPS export ABC transporter protein LptC|nr:LPS export ABC transporter periplasmic protein LptC [Heliobacteriaceae bacterium]
MTWKTWKNLGKKRRAYLIGFAGLAAVMLWAFISAEVITHNFSRNQLSNGQDRQEASVNGLILTETKEGQKYWELYGETGNYDSNNEVAMLNNVVGNFYKDNEVAMSFESSRGAYNAKKKIIILFDDTFIVMKDGITLRTNKLEWSGSDKPITAVGNVKISKGNQLLASAQTIEISPEYDKFKIQGNAVSKIFKENK